MERTLVTRALTDVAAALAVPAWASIDTSCAEMETTLALRVSTAPETTLMAEAACALAAATAARSGHGLLLVRKAGKLPGATLRENYALEYGDATLEVHIDQLPAGTRVLLVDDVLATGGTLAASHRLIERAGWVLAGTAVVLELDGLGGRERLAPRDVHALQTA